jgi:Zn finger protein HypA/HybF involved in hydrogenase expression
MAETMLKGYQCECCGHKWIPREDERPRVCPKCKSAYWDVVRKQDMAKRLAGIKTEDPDCNI